MSQKKLNKNEITFYKLVAVSHEKTDGSFTEGTEFEVEGSIEDHVIVSVPTSMKERSVRELLEKLSKEISSPVIVVTHNISFLKAKKMTPKEVAELARKNTDAEVAK